MLEGHGDDIHNRAQSIESNFSSNIFIGADFSALEQYLCKQISAIHSYPEPTSITLRDDLSQRLAINTNNIWITNGATEAIYQLAHAFQRQKSTILGPTFSEYNDACFANKHQVKHVSSLQEVPHQSDLVWICNPNNPTGKVIDQETITNYIYSHPDQYIILDHSYEYFTKKEILSDNQAIKHKNIVILHSMTKKYAMPGLRLGYIVSSQHTINKIKELAMPWSVNTLAQKAGKFLLENEDSFRFDINKYINETKRFMTQLSTIDGLQVMSTDTHFFLCKLETKKASELKQYLIDKYCILIRDASNFEGLSPNHFRLSTQTPVENNTLVKAIQEWIH